MINDINNINTKTIVFFFVLFLIFYTYAVMQSDNSIKKNKYCTKIEPIIEPIIEPVIKQIPIFIKDTVLVDNTNSINTYTSLNTYNSIN